MSARRWSASAGRGVIGPRHRTWSQWLRASGGRRRHAGDVPQISRADDGRAPGRALRRATAPRNNRTGAHNRAKCSGGRPLWAAASPSLGRVRGRCSVLPGEAPSRGATRRSLQTASFARRCRRSARWRERVHPTAWYLRWPRRSQLISRGGRPPRSSCRAPQGLGGTPQNQRRAPTADSPSNAKNGHSKDALNNHWASGTQARCPTRISRAVTCTAFAA